MAHENHQLQFKKHPRNRLRDNRDNRETEVRCTGGRRDVFRYHELHCHSHAELKKKKKRKKLVPRQKLYTQCFT